MILPKIISTTNGQEHGTDLISEEFIKNRVIYVWGEVSEDQALSVITQLRYLGSKSSRDIMLMINSYGGAVSNGLAIMDVMKRLQCDMTVSTVAIGMAASMGAMLLAAGTKGKRYATPNAEIMIHQPLGGVQGQASDISKAAEHIQKVKANLAAILAEKCGKDSAIVVKDMERDFWMNGELAKEYGIVDHVGFPMN